MAFPLMAIGAGLGQFAQQYQQQQDAAIRRQMLELTLAKYMQELKTKQNDEIATGLVAAYGGGGGSPMSPVSPIQTMPLGGGAMSSPSARPQAQMQPRGSAFEGQHTQDMGYPFPMTGTSAGFPQLPPNTTGNQGVIGPGYPGDDPAQRVARDRHGRPIDTSNLPPPRGGMPTDPLRGYPTAQGGDRNAPLAAVPMLADAGAAAMGQQPQAAQMPPEPVPPPSAMQIAQEIRAKNPTTPTQAIVKAAVDIASKLATQYKQDLDLWKAKTGFAGEAEARAIQRGQLSVSQDNLAVNQGQLAETVQSNIAKEGFEGRRVSEAEAMGKAERTDKEEQRKLREVQIKQQREIADANREARKETAGARATQAQQKTERGLILMDQAIEEAKNLADLVEADPSLVGTTGVVRRGAANIGNQIGAALGRKNPLGTSDESSSKFASRLEQLQTRLREPLLDSKYYSKDARLSVERLLPGLSATSDPVKVAQALRGIADSLGRTAAATRAAVGAVTEDLSKVSDQDILNMLGQTGSQD